MGFDGLDLLVLCIAALAVWGLVRSAQEKAKRAELSRRRVKALLDTHVTAESPVSTEDEDEGEGDEEDILPDVAPLYGNPSVQARSYRLWLLHQRVGEPLVLGSSGHGGAEQEEA